MRIIYSLISLAVLAVLANSFLGMEDGIADRYRIFGYGDRANQLAQVSSFVPTSRLAPFFGSRPNNPREIVEISKLMLDLELSQRLANSTARASALSRVLSRDGRILLSEEQSSDLLCPTIDRVIDRVVERIIPLPQTTTCTPAPRSLTCLVEPQPLIGSSQKFQELRFSFDSPNTSNRGVITRQVYNANNQLISTDVIAKELKPGSDGRLFDALPGSGSAYSIYTLEDTNQTCSYKSPATPTTISAGGGGSGGGTPK